VGFLNCPVYVSHVSITSPPAEPTSPACSQALTYVNQKTQPPDHTQSVHITAHVNQSMQPLISEPEDAEAAEDTPHSS
jgi:hypothetical protein